MKKAYIVENAGPPGKDRVRRYIGNHFEPVKHPRLADLVLVLGGDGTMLKTIRTYLHEEVPFCGLNYGHIGFLMNSPAVGVLEEIQRGEFEAVEINTLRASIYDIEGNLIGHEHAFNDVYFERSSPQTAKIRISVNDTLRFDPLIGDGVIVSTSAGSTAYNASCGGAILPIGTNSMVLTGICPAVFHYWKTALLSASATVVLEPVDVHKRPVRFIVDGQCHENVALARIRYSQRVVRLIFARSQDFREKVMNLQFHSPARYPAG